MPSQDEVDRMSDFENTVFDPLEEDAVCIFFCVFMHNGLKEWLARLTIRMS